MAAANSSKLALAARRIFGEVMNPPVGRSPNKYVRNLMRYDAIANYYPVGHGTEDKLYRRLRVEGIYTDDGLDWEEQKNIMLKLRGKSPPEKGAGKRAGKKK